MKRVIIYIILLWAAASCAPAPLQKSSGLDSPLEFNAVDILETSADSLLGWEDFFADPNLEPYIRKALDNNFDIREAIDQSRIIEEYLKTARVAWLPDLTLAAGGNYRRYTDSEKFQYGSRTQTGYSIPLQLSWEVDIWGRLRKEKQAAASDYLQSAEAVHAVKSNVIAQTAALYYTFQLQKEQEAIMGNLLSLGDSIVSMETKRFELGYASSVDLRQARAQYNTIELTLLEIAGQLSENVNALALVTGSHSLDIPFGSTALGESSPMEQRIFTGIPAQLLRNRPDVAAAEYALHAANARVGVARRNFYPALTISAQGGLSEGKISDLFNIPGALFGVAEGMLVQPIFNRRNIKGAYRQAIIQKEMAETAFQRAFITAVLEVQDAITSASMNKLRLDVSTQRVNDLDTAMQENRVLFRTGAFHYTEYLLLQQTHFEALSEHSAIKSAYYLSLIELYRALGGGV